MDEVLAPQNVGKPKKDYKWALKAEDYRLMFKDHFLPEIKEVYKRDGENVGRSKKFLWQDDHDNKHKSKATQDFIKGLIGEDQ